MPVWAAVVIGLASGLGAGLVGTLLTIRYQREAELRGRQVRAAEDFLRAAEAVRRHARRPQADPSEALRLLQAAWDDLVSPVGLLELLYGYDSLPAGLARVVGNELRDAVDALTAFTAGDEPAGVTVQEHMAEATEAIAEFSRTVHGQLRPPRYLPWQALRISKASSIHVEV